MPADAPSTRCPHCGRQNGMHTCATTPGEPAPDPGDVSICWGCAGIGVFDLVDGVLTVRLPTDDEARDIAEDERLRMFAFQAVISRTPTEAAARSLHALGEVQ